MAESVEVTKPKHMNDTFRGFLIGLAVGGSVSIFYAVVLVIRFHA